MLTDEQQRVVYALDKHVLVSPGAGSGKTRVLVERYVQTLLNDLELSPSNIIAVTYTNRAASEMRNRIKSRLDALIADPDHCHHKERLLNFRFQIDSALIGTIHSLCNSILRTFPEEAQVDPGFEVLDTLDSVELIAESVEQALLQLSDTDRQVQRLLSQYDIDNVIRWVSRSIDRASEFGEACKVLPAVKHNGSSGGDGGSEDKVLPTAEHNDSSGSLRRHAGQLLSAVQELCCAKAAEHNRLNSYLDFAAEFTDKALRNEKLRVALSTVVAVRKRLSAANSTAQKFACLKEIAALKFSGGRRSGDDALLEDQLRELCTWIKQLVADVPEQLNSLDEESFAIIPALITSHKRALEIYKEKKQALKSLDYHDQIAAAHKLLSDPHSRARQHFNQHLAAVLVDEFQDTNTLQSEIIGYLAGPRARVLLIGDEKQSIYKFQGADLSVFAGWTESFSAQEQEPRFNWEGERLLETLSLSFRGHPGLTAFINNVFQRVLNGQSLMRKFHVEYRQLVAAREGEIEARTHLVHFPAGSRGASNCNEAEAVAMWIQNMVQAKAPIVDESGQTRAAEFGDFAVLLPKHASFQQFEETFTLFNLPYASMGGKSFLSTQEVFDLENLLAFINSTLDDQALFGILRSPLFGFSDDVLQLLCNYRQQEHMSMSLWQALISYSAKIIEDERLTHSVETLRLLLDAAQCVSLPELLRKAVELTGYDVTLLSLPSGRRRNRNVWKFISMTEEQESLTVREFLQRLEAARAAGQEDRTAPLDAGNSIKLMTIYQAKGLEFPVVALPCMDEEVNPSWGGSDSKLIFHREYGIAFNTGQSKEKPAYFQVCQFLQNELDAAEKRRLFYVAASRARDHLGIFLQDQPVEHGCFHHWLSEAMASHEVPLPGVPPEQRSIDGAFGAAHYFVHFPQPADTVPTSQQHKIVSESADNDDRGSRLISRLTAGVKNNPALLNSLPHDEPKMQAPPDYWVRTTSPSPHGIVSEVVLGTYFHSIMEYFAATKLKPDAGVMQNLSRYINGRATDADLQAALVREVEKLLPVFYESDLYSIMSSARKLMYERAYFPFKDTNDAHSKRPDLLLQDAHGDWRIVDYKTDAVTPNTLEQEISKHRQQILTYVDDIKAICNIDAPGYLYFARTGELYLVAAC